MRTDSSQFDAIKDVGTPDMPFIPGWSCFLACGDDATRLVQPAQLHRGDASGRWPRVDARQVQAFVCVNVGEPVPEENDVRDNFSNILGEDRY